ncbi:S41 family peptidase [Candidatus Nomurabacteria bacterium]|nr:S41 family peptidase [Candidatus Nomurabacteria bacterium]
MNIYKKFGVSFLVVIIFFLAGIFIGYSGRSEIDKVANIFNKEPSFDAPVDFDPFWKVWNLINEKYPTADNVDDQEKLWGAIDGLARSLGDPYTDFLDPTETKEFEELLVGEISGIGAEVGVKDGFLTVISPLKDSPAEKAGLESGDIILAVDGKTTLDMSVDEAIDNIRGKKGTTVVLTVADIESSTTRDVSVVRDIIEVPALDTEMVDGVFVIHLYDFNQNSSIEFQAALREFLNTSSKKLIIDLRGNPGGYLESSIDIASWFLPSSKVVVRENFGEDTDEVLYRSKGYNIFKPGEVDIAVLIDEGSASASEILAGALKEHGIATLIGTQSFGKGSVQELIPVTYNTYLKITIAKWLTPNGISISEYGLTPDIEVEYDSNIGLDNQLDYAVNYLNDR